MAGYPSRLATNRSNPYIAPGGYMKLEDRGPPRDLRPQGCGTTAVPAPPAPLGAVAARRRASRRSDYYIVRRHENANAAPPCDPQTPLGQWSARAASYPRLQPLP